jgi:hypothetical protein
MALGFASNVRPYFTACFRAHMIKFGDFDLWSAADVEQKWQEIHDRVDGGDMPPPTGTPGACPEGGWDQLTKKQFLADFVEWKNGQFQP